MIHKRSKQVLFKKTILPVWFTTMLILSSCQVEPSPTNTSGALGHQHIIGVGFTGTDKGYWPPQPQGATDIEALSNNSQSLQTQAYVSRIYAAERFKSDDALKKALDRRHASFDIDTYGGKDRPAFTSYFNYERNQTVDAWIDGDNNVQYSVQAAYVTQPPENREEKAIAIELAKHDLLAKGYSDVLDLKGTAILAFPNAQHVARTGQSFYPERMLYITIGQGDGVLPVYRALVNLSRNSVSHSGRIASY